LSKYNAKIITGRLNAAKDNILEGASKRGKFFNLMISSLILVKLILILFNKLLNFIIQNNKKREDIPSAIVVPRIKPLMLVKQNIPNIIRNAACELP
jgi:hypothetical protein